ncbi:hypothetical protein [Saccharopolyspora griseoalba]|uniref:Uncharacterized protein n=1 Tax=Saccharopolyspora griseoalba TaxID=1431848 RepID=A0ABW2LQ27_9PSEU
MPNLAEKGTDLLLAMGSYRWHQGMEVVSRMRLGEQVRHMGVDEARVCAATEVVGSDPAVRRGRWARIGSRTAAAAVATSTTVGLSGQSWAVRARRCA